MTPEVREEILRVYEEEHMLQKDIAERFRISQQLVGNIVRNPAKVAKQKESIMEARRRKKAIEKSLDEAVQSMDQRKRPIHSAQQLAEIVNDETDLSAKTREVRDVLKYELGFSYRRAKEVSVQSNSARCLVLR